MLKGIHNLKKAKKKYYKSFSFSKTKKVLLPAEQKQITA